jgi:pyruvate dehydrogenase E1 component alpha subunit
MFTDRCLAENLLSSDDVAAIESAVAGEVAAAVAYAEAGTLESVDTLTRNVMTPVGGHG